MKSLSSEIIQWVNKSNGWFKYDHIDKDLYIISKSEKTLRRVIIKRLCAKDILIKAKDKNGIYMRKIILPAVNWQQVNIVKNVSNR